MRTIMVLRTLITSYTWIMISMPRLGWRLLCSANGSKMLTSRWNEKKRQILLIMDNAPHSHNSRQSTTHKGPLPASHLQPLDAGIIQNCKSHFRRQQLKLIIDQLDSGPPPSWSWWRHPLHKESMGYSHPRHNKALLAAHKTRTSWCTHW